MSLITAEVRLKVVLTTPNNEVEGIKTDADMASWLHELLPKEFEAGTEFANDLDMTISRSDVVVSIDGIPTRTVTSTN